MYIFTPLVTAFFVFAAVLFVSLSTVDGVASDKIGTSSAVGMHEERLQKFIEEEVLGDGTTLESLLQVEADVQSGSTTAAHEKQKLLSKTKNFLANKIADHLLNEQRLAEASPENAACQSSMEQWIEGCVFKGEGM